MRFISDTLLTRWLLLFVVIILVVMPFHATLTVWLASIFGHYTVVRLWKEVLLAVLLLMVVALLIKSPEKRQKLWQEPHIRPLFLLIGMYIVLHVLVACSALLRDDVTLKALGYGFISNLRFLLFFTVCVVVASCYLSWVQNHWKRLLLWPAAIVVGFGLLQAFVLPIDFLRHTGYGPDTIAPYIAVDEKVEYARVQSSLRGPNPLGAYLVIIVTALVGFLLKNRLRSWQLPLAVIATLTVLYGTYSRSAYIGAVVSIALLIWLMARTAYVRKLLLIIAAAMLIVGAGLVIVLRNNDHVQNILFHTDEHSRSSSSSNESRAGVMRQGVDDIAMQPLGRGPGTAGPASVYNDGNARVSENYFLQIAQEVGVLGLAIFLAICFFVGRALWYVRSWSSLPLILFASLVGISVVNIVSHAWADDTLAYIWWGFAGLTLGAALFAPLQKGKQRGKKTV